VPEPGASPLAAWESFYVIVGSSAAALTGLMFVVMALIADHGRQRSSQSPQIAAFGTPTIVHFCAALLVSAILSAPWRAIWSAGLALTVCGVAGVVYTAVVIRRARRQTGYAPVLEDWLWHAAFPVVAYVALLTASILLNRGPEICLFVIGAATVSLVFIGIHNSWDTVTYIALDLHEPPDDTRNN